MTAQPDTAWVVTRRLLLDELQRRLRRRLCRRKPSLSRDGVLVPRLLVMLSRPRPVQYEILLAVRVVRLNRWDRVGTWTAVDRVYEYADPCCIDKLLRQLGASPDG